MSAVGRIRRRRVCKDECHPDARWLTYEITATEYRELVECRSVLARILELRESIAKKVKSL